MGMFNMGGVATTKVVNNDYLKAGIHNVIFKGLDKAQNLNAIEFRFEAVDGSGIHNERLFEPQSAERNESQFGAIPSQTEQFMCKIKQIIDALDPDLGKMIEENGNKFAAPDFEGFIMLLKRYLDKRVGVETQIKLVPTKGSYVGFPAFVANLSKDGVLYMNTKVIGNNLTLTPKEVTAIENAKNAKPTDMKSRDNELDDLKDDFDIVDKKAELDDDLPFG